MNAKYLIVFLDTIMYNYGMGAMYNIVVRGMVAMGTSYKKLWKLLIDRDLKKRDLCALAHVSPTSIAKLSKGENVNTDILVRICGALGCDISDIMEIVPGEAK